MSKGKEHKHEHNVIPSPFPAVNSYEKEFVKKYNNSLSVAVKEVLQYLARKTAADIKNGIQGLSD